SQLLPVVGVRVVRDRVGDRRDRDERRVAWGARPERNNEGRQVPDILGLLDAVEKGGHRGAEDAVGEAGGDLGPARASAEGPPLGEVRGRDRVAPLVLQLGARRAVGPPGGAVALVTLDRLEHLLAALDRLRGRGDVLRQLEVLRTLLELLRRERLDVRDEIPPVLFGEYRPRGHRRSGHAVRDDPEDILVRQDLVRRRPDLVEARGEVAGLRGKQLGGRSLAIPLVIVAARAFPFVYGLSRARPASRRAPGSMRFLPSPRMLPRRVVEIDDGLPDLLLGQALLPGGHDRVPGGRLLREPGPALRDAPEEVRLLEHRDGAGVL